MPKKPRTEFEKVCVNALGHIRMGQIPTDPRARAMMTIIQREVLLDLRRSNTNTKTKT